MPTSRDTPTPTPLPQLKPVELLILIELFGRDHHGYGLVRAIAESTGYGVRLVSGNLYRVLLRLIERGLIKETAERPDADNDDERRRYLPHHDGGTDPRTSQCRAARGVGHPRAQRYRGGRAHRLTSEKVAHRYT